MKRLTSRLEIGQYVFAGVVELSIESTWATLTDTCTITFPRKLSFEGKDIAKGVNPLLKKGDKVKVELGYDGLNKLEFEGYINNIKAGTPLRIDCEDAAFLLKQQPQTISYRSVSLRKLLNDILPADVPFQATDQELGQLRIQNATPAQILGKLAKSHHVKAFFKGGKLYAGLAYPQTGTLTRHYFEFQRNIISDNLSYRRAEDIKVKVKAVSMQPDNTKLEVEVGATDGEVRTFHYYNISSKSELKKLAEQEIDRLKIEGWKGDFLAFGQPFVQHGDGVKIVDKKLDRRGSFLVKKVVTTFGGRGFRRQIYLDRAE